MSVKHNSVCLKCCFEHLACSGQQALAIALLLAACPVKDCEVVRAITSAEGKRGATVSICLNPDISNGKRFGGNSSSSTHVGFPIAADHGNDT